MGGPRVQSALLALGAVSLGACWDFEIRCAADGSCPRGLACDTAGRCTPKAATEAGAGIESAAGAAEPGPVGSSPVGTDSRDDRPLGGGLPGVAPGADGTPTQTPQMQRGDAGVSVSVAPPPVCGVRTHECCAEGLACGSGLYCDRARGICSACASFRGLGFLPEQTDSHALGLSADGTLAVGTGRAQFSVDEAMIWRVESGAVERLVRSFTLDRGNVVTLPTTASAASADGRVIVGYGVYAVELADNRISRSESVFFARLPEPAQAIFPGRALAVSADGSAFVGWSGDPNEAFWWTAASGPVGLGAAHALSSSQALGISADGRFAVGSGTAATGDTHALRWSAGGEVLDLGVLPGASYSVATAVNADGSVVVGSSSGRAFRWRDGALEALPGLEEASATSAAGDVVVGASGGLAMLWDAGPRGARAVSDELGALVPAGWVLRAATGISADGVVLVGHGKSPNVPVEEGWVAMLGPDCPN